MNLRRRGRVVAALAVTAAVVIAAVVALVAVAGRPAPVTTRVVRIGVVDGPRDDQHVVLDATFFTPDGGGRVPAVLLAHGFGETKNTVRPQALQLARAGFAVLTWSARGFGASTGQIALDSPDYEGKDVEQLVSWLARQPRVLLDHPGDPRVGIAGGSYGGAIALLAAAYDRRVDAIVPQVTWNNLATALFPNAAGDAPQDGVFKKQWAGLLFTQGSAGFGAAAAAGSGAAAAAASAAAGQGLGAAIRSAECGRFLPRVCAVYQQIAAQGRPTPQAIALMLRSSPASVARRIEVPALLIQGENDSLFGLDQADANYQAIRRNGAPADMVWFAGGHDGGDQETARINQLTLQWFDRWLRSPRPPLRRGSGQGVQPRTGQPAFAVTRNLGFDPSSDQEVLRIATAPGYPGLHGTRQRVIRMTGPAQPVVNPAGGAPASISAFPGLGSLGPAGSGLAFDMPGQSAAFASAPLRDPVQITGAPTAAIRVRGTAQVTLFAKVYDVDQAGNATLPYQLAVPLRVPESASWQTVTVQLPAMDYQFNAGHRLSLVLTTTDFGYAASPAPAVYQVALAGPGLSVPSDPALAVQNGGLPWWTPAAPAAALLAAAVILLARRRRATSEPRPELAEVPLDIRGLTKKYRNGQLAVDRLSLRVERGQILGLLGPNGAGKTTTLRLMMGLLHPEAGMITIFGRQVHPGAPALSRLGAFVEGPGFLPHLSGRSNLELYWRAIGRQGSDSKLSDVLAIASLGAAIDRPVRTYSHGMRQRLAIAQAMLGLPDLLVLDEPLNGLDPPQISQMRDVLVRYAAEGRTVVLSSHMLAEVEQTCTHVVVMHLGRRLAAGPVSEIIGDGGALMVGTTEGGRAVGVLRELTGIEHAEPHQEGVLVRPGRLAASEIVAALVRAGIPVERVGASRRLEDAFLSLIAEPVPGRKPEASLEPAGSEGAR